MISAEILGSNPFETFVQAISAVATAAAAIFAALSARSAAMSAKEMEQARELSSSPILTITPNTKDLRYHFDLGNQIDGIHPYKEQFALENHGNGPALNISLHYALDLTEKPLDSEILVVEIGGKFPAKCFASSDGIRWEGHRARPTGNMLLESQEFIVSLAKSETESISISSDLMRRWILDAISFNAANITEREHVAHLTVTATFDTVLKRAQQRVFRFRFCSCKMPPLGEVKDRFGGHNAYVAMIEPMAI